MKKSSLLVILSLLLSMTSIQPAVAKSASAANDTPYSVNGVITYGTMLCKTDRPFIPAHKTWSHGDIGLCLTKTVEWTANGHKCELWYGRTAHPTKWVIKTGAMMGHSDVYCVYTSN